MTPCRSRAFVRTLFLSICAVLAVATATAAPSLPPTTPSPARTGPAVRYAEDGRGGPTLTIDVPAADWEAVPATELEPAAVMPAIPGFGRLGTVGAPDVPQRIERVAVEPGGGLAIADVQVEWAEGLVPGPLAAFPAYDPNRPALDGAFASGGWWPAEPVRLVREDGALRSLHFAEIAVLPLQVDAAAGRFRIARRITITLQRAGVARATSSTSAGAPSLERAPAGRELLLDGDLAATLVHGASSVGRALSIASPAGPRSMSATAADAAEATEAAPTYPAWQIDVTTEGLHRITHAWAQANAPGLFSFLTANDPRRYRLSSQGVALPILVQGEADGVFGPGDAIVFYGQPVSNVDLYAKDVWQDGRLAKANVYRLDVADGPPRVAADPSARAAASGYTVAPSFRTTVRHEEAGFFLGFVPQDGVDHWYASDNALQATCRTNPTTCDALPTALCEDPANNVTCSGAGQVCCAGALDQAVSTPAHAGGSVTLRARLLGYNYARNYHRSELYVKGVLRDTKDWDGYREFTQGADSAAITFDATLDATTAIKVRLPLGRTGAAGKAARDIVAANWFELDYDRRYAAAADALAFTAPNAARELRLESFGGVPEVWEITDGAASPAGMTLAVPQRVNGVVGCAGAQCFEILADARPATRRFVAAGPNGFVAPAASAVREDRPPSSLDPSLGSSLKNAGLGADWVVLGHRSLLDMGAGSRLRALKAHREGQGYTTAVIDVQDVYDDFTDGIAEPEAIQRFAAHALSNWSPKPSFLLLVGDATRDYQGFYGHAASRQFVPTYMFDFAANSQFGYYLSDTWFTAVAGTDALPDIAVGRIPAHTLAEAEEVFRKTHAYETGAKPASWAGKACLVSECEGPGCVSFRQLHDQIYADWFTGTPQRADKVYEQSVDEDPACSSPPCPPRPMNQRINACINTGAGLLSYIGHGGYKAWGLTSSFFTTASPTDPAPPTGPNEDLSNINAGTPLQFQVHGNCITAHFAADNTPGSSNDGWYTFIEDWLTTANKGVVGALGPSHLVYNQNLSSILLPVYEGLYGRTKERLVARLDMKMRLAFADLGDVADIRSFVLEGDPALTLAVPAPAPPTNVSVAKNGSRTLRVSWSGAAGAANYRVYRATVADGTYTLARTVSSGTTAVDDTGLENCREYFYYVVAVDADGFESRWSNYNATCYGDRSDCRAGTPENPSGPGVPSAVGATDTQQGGQVEVTWTAPSDPFGEITVYRVAWSLSSGGPEVGFQTTGAASRSIAIGGLQNGTTYWFRVRAENCSRPGAYSADVSAVPHIVKGLNPPDAVSDLRVTREGSNLRLSWTIPGISVWGTGTSVSKVEVYGSQSGPVFALDAATKRGEVAAPGTSWVHTGQGASGSGRWYYTVVAVDAQGRRSAGGDEALQGIDSLTVERLAGPQDRLRFTPVTKNLDDRPARVARYNLYGRASVLGRADCAPANRLATCTACTEFVRAEPAGTFYTWQVLAEDSYGGESIW